MANHKWKDESISKYNKQGSCVKCGVFRQWYGESYQCWHYTIFEGFTAEDGSRQTSRKETFKRPDCIPKN